MSDFTFKAQAKSNAKRFLTKTCKIEEASLEQYLTQVMDQWGTYIDAEGKPVPHAMVEGATSDANLQADEVPPPQPDAFSNFALAQLTAPSNSAAPADQQAGRTSRESSTANGLKIEKNRPSQNGITRPSQGTTCHAVWTLCEKMTADLGRTVPLSALVEAAKGHEINQFTARTQYACWRKFNGIVGHLAK